jgi:hypothetical protein
LCVGVWSTEKFMMYLVFMFLSLLMYTSFGIMCVALTASLTSANVIATTGYAVWNLMAGFILPHPVRCHALLALRRIFPHEGTRVLSVDTEDGNGMCAWKVNVLRFYPCWSYQGIGCHPFVSQQILQERYSRDRKHVFCETCLCIVDCPFLVV